MNNPHAMRIRPRLPRNVKVSPLSPGWSLRRSCQRGRGALRERTNVGAFPPNTHLPPGAELEQILEVDYARVRPPEGGELYLTRYGLPFYEHLLPANWLAKEWFEAKRERLRGTSTVYVLPSREVRGASLPLVVKWSRFGTDVPLDMTTLSQNVEAEFNLPFEEFSLVMELRQGAYGPCELHLRTQKPLGIYVPPQRLELWQTGRSESKFAAKAARGTAEEIDIRRQYILIYSWIKGLDLAQAADLLQVAGDEREKWLAVATWQATQQLERKGYRMLDMKPEHLIVRPQSDFSLLRDSHGEMIYAVIDYELLERTPAHEARRQLQLSRQAFREAA